MEDLTRRLGELKERRPGALDALVSEFSGPLYAGGLGLGFAPTDAEELVQDTLAAFLEALDRFEGRSSLKTYLFGILYNKASELRRKRRREEASEDIEAILDSRADSRGHWIKPPQGPPEAALNAEIAKWIALCMDNLPMAQRAAFHMKEVEGSQPDEIRNVLGVSATHLRVLLFRARGGLRECLERHWLRESKT